MGYMKIVQLYKCKEMFKYKEIIASEKIHGTSTNFHFKDNELKFHCGGETAQTFEALFDKDFLLNELTLILKENKWTHITVYGEAYGGKQQGMFETYGPKLKFIVFDIKVTLETAISYFLDFFEAEKLAERLKLDFVPYIIGHCTTEFLQEQCYKDSVQAMRNGITDPKMREGIVIRPLKEDVFNDGTRAICKYINDPFRETKSSRPIGPNSNKLKIFTESEEIANEWVTENRFNHVSSKFLHTKENKILEKTDVGKLIDLMIGDIKLEAGNEIIWTPEIIKTVKHQTGKLVGTIIRNQM